MSRIGRLPVAVPGGVEVTIDGQQVTVNHRLQMNAIRGKEALCQAQDYPAFRELFQQVRRGFRGQVVYGELANGAVSQAGG